jgi:O-antigen ligase
MVEALTIIYALVILFLTRKDIRYGLAGFILVSIFPQIQGKEMFGITGFNATNLIFLGVILKYYLPRFAGKVQENEKTTSYIITLILILLFFQIIFTIRYLADFNRISIMGIINATNSHVIKPFLYYIVLYILFKTIKNIRDIKIFLIVTCIATLLGALVLFYQSTILQYSRQAMWWNEFAGHKNTYGVKLAFFTLISFVFYFYSYEKKIKILSLIGIIIGGSVLIFSLSRTAWLAFMIGMIFIILKSKMKKLLLLIPVIFIVFASTPLFDVVEERIYQRNAGGSELNQITSGRVEQKWQPQIDAIIENPIFGGGRVGLLGHNGYLAVWNQIGILGLVLTIITFYKMYVEMKLLNDSIIINSNIVRAFTITGMALVIAVPVVNLTGSLIFFKYESMPTLFLLMFFYISSLKLKEIIVRTYYFSSKKYVEPEKVLSTVIP